VEVTVMNNTLSRDLAARPLPAATIAEDSYSAVDLRQLLADLGDRLMQEHGFSPAELHGCSTYVNRTTEPLVRFLVWLQHTPEVGEVLRELGAWQRNSRVSGLDDEPVLRGPVRRSWPGTHRNSAE
jgi:hypothetical protein